MKVSQSCPTLWDPTDYTVHGILQVRTVEWVAFPFSRGSSQLRDRTQVLCIAGEFFTLWATREAPTWILAKAVLSITHKWPQHDVCVHGTTPWLFRILDASAITLWCGSWIDLALYFGCDSLHFILLYLTLQTIVEESQLMGENPQNLKAGEMALSFFLLWDHCVTLSKALHLPGLRFPNNSCQF